MYAIGKETIMFLCPLAWFVFVAPDQQFQFVQRIQYFCFRIQHVLW